MKTRPILSWALLGPAVVGAWIALRLTVSNAPFDSFGALLLRLAVGLPLAILGAAILTAPALYIGSAFMKVKARPREMLKQIAIGLDGAGLVMLGLMPAVLFLGATISDPIVATLIASAALGGSVIFGVRLLFGRLYESGDDRIRALPVYGAWAVVSLGIGLMMTVRIMKGGA